MKTILTLALTCAAATAPAGRVEEEATALPAAGKQIEVTRHLRGGGRAPKFGRSTLGEDDEECGATCEWDARSGPDSKGEYYTCQERIDFLMTPEGGSLSKTEACKKTAADFYDPCGGCKKGATHICRKKDVSILTTRDGNAVRPNEPAAVVSCPIKYSHSVSERLWVLKETFGGGPDGNGFIDYKQGAVLYQKTLIHKCGYPGCFVVDGSAPDQSHFDTYKDVPDYSGSAHVEERVSHHEAWEKNYHVWNRFETYWTTGALTDWKANEDGSLSTDGVQCYKLEDIHKPLD